MNNLEEIFNKIKNADELMDFLNKYITYGWISIDGEKKINTLEGVHTKYKINSLQQVFESGLGTCIEQAKLIQKFFNDNDYKTHIYCSKTQNLKSEMLVHCYIIAEKDDKFIYFEHSHEKMRGIHYFNNLNDAYEFAKVNCYKSEQREVTEIGELKDNLTFSEFIDYVDLLKIDESKMVL